MIFREIIWKEEFVEKLATKHGVMVWEVEDVFDSRPHVRIAEKGNVTGENIYAAYGQTAGGAIFGSILYKQVGRSRPAHFGTRYGGQ